MVTVTHSTVVAVPDDGTSPVGTDEWNADHVVTGVRELLTADRTYYVSTTGDNGGDGSSGNPWATLQYAYDYICSALDLAGYTITIQFADGTYAAAAGALAIGTTWTGGGAITLQGNTGDQDAVILEGAGAGTFCLAPAAGTAIALPGILTVRYFRINNAGGAGLVSAPQGQVIFEYVDTGACAGQHYTAWSPGGILWIRGDYTIYGDAAQHLSAYYAGAQIWWFPGVVTASGTRNFTTAFAQADLLAGIEAYHSSLSGTVTGARYAVSLNGVINTYGSGANFLPGDSAGSTATGGQYS
jgi:hypothetical protein